jgi:hypothetical protein
LKAFLSLYSVIPFNSSPRHEGILGEWRYSSTHSLTPPRKRAPGTHWIGGWVGPRAILDVVVKRKIPSPHWESNPRIPMVPTVSYTSLLVRKPEGKRSLGRPRQR